MEPIAQINFQNLVAFALKLPEGPSSVLSEELLKEKLNLSLKESF